MTTSNEALRKIPSVEKAAAAVGDVPGIPRPLAVETIRRQLDAFRTAARDGKLDALPSSADEMIEAVRAEIAALSRSRLRPVLNATGVLVHTNLGRSPLSATAADAVRAIAFGYSNLEFTLETGDRGPRAGFAESALAALCEAEAAAMVNNCAAALVLTLRCLAPPERPEVVISRGELIEIGGGFRIPEILEASGATLREVGATNKTRLADYEKAISPRTGMILKVHRSNFSMSGFVESADPGELSALARRVGVPLVEDLGSGAVIATDSLAPVPHEPTPAEALRRGIDLVTFSGDKLLGGPQAGIIAGRADLVRAIKREPFFRAVRCDKIILAVLQETADAYLRAKSGELPEDAEPPVVAMLRTPPAELEQRAKAILDALPETIRAAARVVESIARCGGGTMPDAEIPSRAIAITPPDSPEALARRLRMAETPVVGFVAEDAVHLDLRTIPPQADARVRDLLRAAFSLPETTPAPR